MDGNINGNGQKLLKIAEKKFFPCHLPLKLIKKYLMYIGLAGILEFFNKIQVVFLNTLFHYFNLKLYHGNRVMSYGKDIFLILKYHLTDK